MADPKRKPKPEPKQPEPCFGDGGHVCPTVAHCADAGLCVIRYLIR